MSIKITLDSNRAIARALAAGRVVWCPEIGIGHQAGPCSLNHARRRATWLVGEAHAAGFSAPTFFFIAGDHRRI